MMSRQMVNSILELSEVQRFSKGIFCWVGFNTKWIPYENIERVIGTTKWSFWGLFRYAIDGITAFSVAPLRFISVLGFFISLISFIYIIVTLIQTLAFGIDVPGYVTNLCAVAYAALSTFADVPLWPESEYCAPQHTVAVSDDIIGRYSSRESSLTLELYRKSDGTIGMRSGTTEYNCFLLKPDVIITRNAMDYSDSVIVRQGKDVIGLRYGGRVYITMVPTSSRKN